MMKYFTHLASDACNQNISSVQCTGLPVKAGLQHTVSKTDSLLFLGSSATCQQDTMIEMPTH